MSSLLPRELGGIGLCQMVNFYAIADTHFDHRKIIQYENRPEDYGNIIINNWNSVVTNKDVIYIAGDFCFAGKKRHEFYCNKLNGKKILVRGNHDDNSDSYYYDVGFNFVCDSFVLRKYGKKILITHRPQIEQIVKSDYDINIHGHIHSKRLEDSYSIEPKYINCFKCVSVERVNYTPISLQKLLDKNEKFWHI